MQKMFKYNKIGTRNKKMNRMDLLPLALICLSAQATETLEVSGWPKTLLTVG